MSDLISRQALCEYALNQKDKSVTPNDIMRFPSAQPERKTGKWIENPVKEYCSRDCWYPPTNKWDTWNEEEGYWLEDEIFCSECNYHDYQRLKTKFCPNCGAKMEGEG